jgi:hypothetical protein
VTESHWGWAGAHCALGQEPEPRLVGLVGLVAQEQRPEGLGEQQVQQRERQPEPPWEQLVA